MNVLVVEDNVDIAMLLDVMLTGEGHSISRWTSNFDTIIELAPWGSIDAVIVDQQLGDYDGKEICAWLAREHPRIRRIFLTGSSLVTPEEASAHVVLIKPSSPAGIMQALQS